jgi:hypothetical protein
MAPSHDNRPSGFTARKIVLLATGWTLVIVGPLVGILPGPGGIPIVGAGLVLILSQSYTAKRVFVRLERRYPRFVGPLRRFISRGRQHAKTQSAEDEDAPSKCHRRRA